MGLSNDLGERVVEAVVLGGVKASRNVPFSSSLSD
jgi:hypothetical protein